MMLTRRNLIIAVGGLFGGGLLLRELIPAGQAAGPTESFAMTRSEEEWRQLLTPEQFKVLRKHGTERPWSSPLNEEHRPGTFHCAACAHPLFAAATKFDSGTGWPSFFDHLPGGIGTREDRSIFMVRTEVHCANCGGHLGHVFNDGPKPIGLRYCMNGVSLKFEPASA